ncbi:MAG: ABC transporter substrate-binding protein [Thermoplasmata archaeon]|nr:ABC transporter substrate-binding protein [Thermoplasmata archaeon]
MHGIGRILLVWVMVSWLIVQVPCGTEGTTLNKQQVMETPEFGQIIAGSVLDIQTLNPCTAEDDYTLRVLSLVYDSLAYTNRTTGSAEPGLAASWETADGLTWTVKLRDNLKWHDGTLLTADDVVFTYNFILNPEAPLKTSEYFKFLKWTRIPGATDKNENYWEAVQKVDATTVKFVLNKTVWDFGITILSLPILKKDIWKNHWDDATSWNLDHNSTTGASKSTGSGPFRMVLWKPGIEIVLAPNTEYYKSISNGIKIVKYPSYLSLLEAVKNREVSLVFHPVSSEFLPDFSQVSSFSAFPHKEREVTFLGFNLEKYFEGYDEGSGYEQRSSVDDPVTYPIKVAGTDAGLQFRNAAGYLLPNSQVEARYSNFLIWENSLVQKGDQYYNTSVKTYTQNISQAITLLNTASYKDMDGDGWREDYNGRKMGHDGVVKIYIEEKTTINQQVAMWFCANLRTAGVYADTEPLQVLNIRDYDLFLCSVKVDETFEYIYKLISSKYDYTDGITNGENLWRYRNPDTDNLTGSMLSTTQGFANAIKYVQGIVSSHLPLIPVYSEILYDVVDISRVMIKPVPDESVLEKHNLVSMSLASSVSIEAYAVPYRLNAVSGSQSEIVVRASDPAGNPVVNAEVQVKISPSSAITPDATSKTTDSNGCAFFTLGLTKTLDVVQLVSVECLLPSNGVMKRFYVLLEPFELEINIVSELFVKGLANNTYTFSFEILNSGVAVKEAFSRVVYVSDARIKPLIAENVSDASGTAALEFLITEDFIENSYLQISFAVSVAGGEERAYSAALVVTTAGSLEVTITATCQGVSWKTGNGEINGSVTYEGNPVGAMTVKCGIMELDGIFEIENPELVTDSQGAVKFSVTMNEMPVTSRVFDYYLVVCTSGYHGAVYARSLLQIPDAVTVTAQPSVIEIKGESGNTANLVVKVEAEGTGITNALVFGWKDRADGKVSVLGIPAFTNGSGNTEIRIRITGDYTDNAVLQLTLRGLFWGRENGCTVSVNIAKATIPVVALSLSETEMEGVQGNSVIASVHVSKGGLPLSGVNVSLTLSSKANLEIAPASVPTDASGNAEFEISVIANFTKEANITVSAKAIVGGNQYSSNPAYLQIYPAGTALEYTVTLGISDNEVTGKQGTSVMLTGNLKRSGLPVSGVNFTVDIAGSGDILIEPQTYTTDANGNAYFTLTVTRNLDKDADVVLRGKVSISGKDYYSQPVTLKIKAYVQQKTPGFDLPIVLLVLAVLVGSSIMRKKDYIGKRFKA